MEPVNFYIECFEYAWSDIQTWLIYRASPSSCVGVHGNREAAIAAVIPMAQYCIAAGGTAHIFIRDHLGDAWREIVPPDLSMGR